jgi:hypothetical protein
MAGEVNLKFRLALLSKWPTQADAASALGMDPSNLSLLVRGRRRPTEYQLKILRNHFSDYRLRKWFPPELVEIQRGESAVNE